jgi:hypothetical protein
MKAIETIMDVKDNGEFVLHFPREVKQGRPKTSFSTRGTK